MKFVETSTLTPVQVADAFLLNTSGEAANGCQKVLWTDTDNLCSVEPCSLISA